ncbi:MAG: retropepsin-like aspartic protease [Chitinophagaceae bacterium]
MRFINVFLILFLTHTLGYSQTVVKLTKKGSLYFIPCKINGVSLDFIFDTGASDVLISKEVAINLQKQGKIKNSDFLMEPQKYQTASGDIIENEIIYLKEIEINGLVLNDVKASISTTPQAPLLLGQSVLSKFGEYTFNYSSNNLTINSNIKVDINKQLEQYKKKMKESGFNLPDQESYLQKMIRNEKIKREINYLVEFEIVKISEEIKSDGKVLSFSYDITNNSIYDYTFVPLGFNYVFIDIFTDDGKIYSDKQSMKDILANKTAEGHVISVNIRNKKAKYFRIYPCF